MALTTAFARNGNRKAVPQTTADGSVSYNEGFGAFYALPPEEGGLFIDRAQFNQIMYDTTSAVITNQNSINTLNSSVNTLNTKVANIESGVATGVVNLTTNQIINGIKTFSVPPVSATNPSNNNQVANKAYVDSVGNTAVKLTGTQSIAGAKTFTNNITAPNITQMQNNLNTIFSSTTSPVKTQTARKTIAVGTGGDFANLSQAFYEAKKYNSPVTIQLVSDLKLSETLQIDSVNGKHIMIDFNNYKITNSSAAPISLIFTACAIGRIMNLKLVNINFVVGTNSQIALGGTGNIQSNQRINGGNEKANDAVIFVVQGSLLNFTDSANYTLKNLDNSNVISSGTGAIISLSSLTVITATTQTGNLFAVYNAGIIAIHGETTINKPAGLNLYNVTVNTPSPNGLILGKTNY